MKIDKLGAELTFLGNLTQSQSVRFGDNTSNAPLMTSLRSNQSGANVGGDAGTGGGGSWFGNRKSKTRRESQEQMGRMRNERGSILNLNLKHKNNNNMNENENNKIKNNNMQQKKELQLNENNNKNNNVVMGDSDEENYLKPQNSDTDSE